MMADESVISEQKSGNVSLQNISHHSGLSQTMMAGESVISEQKSGNISNTKYITP